MRKWNWKKILKQLLDGIICGILIFAEIFGFFALALLVIFLHNRQAVIENWMVISAMIASTIFTFSLLFYLGGNNK